MERSEKIRQMFDENKKMLLDADTTTKVRKNGVCYDGVVDDACRKSK